MALIVQKYGGTSLGTLDHIKNVARRVVAARDGGDEVVIVVSAMSGETSRLLTLLHRFLTHRMSGSVMFCWLLGSRYRRLF